jgi:hypothetical protein
MKYQKYIYFIIGLISIIGGIYFFSFGNNNEIQTTEKVKVADINKKTDTNIQKAQQGGTTSLQKNNDDSLPEEYRIVAEEILYPKEFDFGHLSDFDSLMKVGKPIKFDAIQIADMKVGDILTLELDGKKLVSYVQDIKLEYFDAKDTDPGNGAVTTYRFNGTFDSKNEETYNNSIYGVITINSEGVLNGEININAGFGSDYRIYLYKQLAYYATDRDMQLEFGRKGKKID